MNEEILSTANTKKSQICLLFSRVRFCFSFNSKRKLPRDKIVIFTEFCLAGGFGFVWSFESKFFFYVVKFENNIFQSLYTGCLHTKTPLNIHHLSPFLPIARIIANLKIIFKGISTARQTVM